MSKDKQISEADKYINQAVSIGAIVSPLAAINYLMSGDLVFTTDRLKKINTKDSLRLIEWNKDSDLGNGHNIIPAYITDGKGNKLFNYDELRIKK